MRLAPLAILLVLLASSVARAADAPTADTLTAARADLDAKRWQSALDLLAPYKKDLEANDPRSPRLAEVLHAEGEGFYLSGEWYRAHEDFRAILERFRTFPRLADVIAREYEIGTAFIDGKAEKPVLFFHTKSRSLGAEILEFLVDNYQEKFFDTAQYLVADFYFQDSDYRRAADGYQRVVDEFPTSPWVSPAMFQRAVCFLRESRGHRYDDTPVRKAEALLREYARRFPRGDRIKEAEAALQKIRADRGRFYLETAHYYAIRESRARAALIYVEAILRETPDAPAASEVGPILERCAKLAEKESDGATLARAKELQADFERRKALPPAAGATSAPGGNPPAPATPPTPGTISPTDAHGAHGTH